VHGVVFMCMALGACVGWDCRVYMLSCCADAPSNATYADELRPVLQLNPTAASAARVAGSHGETPCSHGRYNGLIVPSCG
jgi:hypothetical protein